MKKARIQTPTESYKTYYPQFVDYADKQLGKFFWSHAEIEVEKDKQDFLINLTDAERHAVSYAAKVFVKYELFIGDEYWKTRIAKMFPRPEVERMAAAFTMTELCVHAPFYDKVNIALGLNTDEFYTSYVDDEELKDRIDYLNNLADSDDDLLALAVFSLMEGAVLFSSFALFKSFQSNGHNLLSNTCRGINQSILDENLHHEGGAALFRQLVKELKLKPDELSILHEKIKVAAAKLYEHEDLIIEKFHEKGSLRGISKANFKTFVKSRVNHCLNNFNISPLFDIIEPNPVAAWFEEKMVSGYVMNDFFAGVGREYQKSWDEKKFTWKTKEKND